MLKPVGQIYDRISICSAGIRLLNQLTNLAKQGQITTEAICFEEMLYLF